MLVVVVVVHCLLQLVFNPSPLSSLPHSLPQHSSLPHPSHLSLYHSLTNSHYYYYYSLTLAGSEILGHGSVVKSNGALITDSKICCSLSP